jgi:hypothetical protein
MISPDRSAVVVPATLTNPPPSRQTTKANDIDVNVSGVLVDRPQLDKPQQGNGDVLGAE